MVSGSGCMLDTQEVTTAELAMRPHATRMTLDDVAPMLASPDSKKGLAFLPGYRILSDGIHTYPDREDVQILLPARLQEYFSTRLEVPLGHYEKDSFLQYFLLSTIKQFGVINAPSDDTHYQRHLHRTQLFLQDAKGVILDVGCDDPRIGASILPASARYIGLDPFCMRTTPFRLIGVGEYLPFKDNSLDGVLFNTSLDHILDWRRAIEEAHRVLAPRGMLYLSTIAWTDRAGLITDSVHFHHFRDYELFGALEGFKKVSEQRYDYKGDDHRHGLYLSAQKTA
jgi:hypothetical protein